MQKTEEFCVDESGWIHCPFCKCRTRTKIRADTSLKNFPIFCPKCKQECLIDVDNMKIRLSVVPDAKTQSLTIRYRSASFFKLWEIITTPLISVFMTGCAELSEAPNNHPPAQPITEPSSWSSAPPGDIKPARRTSRRLQPEFLRIHVRRKHSTLFRGTNFAYISKIIGAVLFRRVMSK